MARKADLLEKANNLGLKMTEKNTVAEIEAAIAGAPKADTDSEEPTTAADKNVLELAKDEAEKVKVELAEEVAELTSDSAEEEFSEESKKTSKKKAQPQVRAPRKRGKKYKEAKKAIEEGKRYTLNDAVALLPKTKVASFDPAVELHIRLGVDPKSSDEMVRGSVSLPHGTGKEVRVAALVPEAEVKNAKAAGADIAGEDDLLAKIGKEEFDFDILIATPELMGKLGQHAKVLGPKGLMPNPKSGTVNKDFAKAIRETKAGKVEFRIDSYGIIHASVGKLSFGDANLLENLGALIDAIRQAKPSGLKKTYFETAYLTTSMGPSIQLDPSSL